MLAIALALCAAACNAVGSVFQRRAARTVPDADAMSPRLVKDLLHRPVWLIGVAGLIGGFGCQIAALSSGSLALVQPLLVSELPLTLLLAIPALGSTPGRRGWRGIAAVCAGLALLLLCADPRPGTHHPGWLGWTVAGGVVAALLAGLLGGSRIAAGPLRTALLAGAAGLGFGATAAVMKVTSSAAGAGLAGVLTSWPPYVMVAVGIFSFTVLQNAFQSGALLYAQPAVTIVDPVAATILGLLLFHDRLRGGSWLGGELAGAALLAWGSIVISHAPVFSVAEGG